MESGDAVRAGFEGDHRLVSHERSLGGAGEIGRVFELLRAQLQWTGGLAARPARRIYQRDPRPRPPPPPPPPCGLGRASLTFRARPFISAPLSCEIAVSAALRSVISTKAKPRGCPVSRSVTMLTRSTAPYWANAACNSSCVV